MRTRLPDSRHAPALHKRACGICQSAVLMVVCLVMLAALMTSGRNAQAAADLPGSSPGAALPAAQVIAPRTDGAPERAAERRQIQQQRRDLDAAYAHQQASCQHRFFVNQCLQEASRRYRSAAGSLDAQLNALNLAAREQRAAAERARVERNLRERQQPSVKPIQTQPTELGQEQADKQRSQAERQEREADHEAAYAAKQEQASKRLQRSPKPHGKIPPRVPAPAAHTSQPESAYAAKLADYQRRQRDAARRAQQKAPAPPLPLPPGY